MAGVRQQDVDTGLDRAERRFNKCWSYLTAIKAGKFSKDKLDPLVEFQPVLATALFDLSRVHVRIAKERQARISDKGRYAPSWFKARMSFLSRQQERLVEALQIGRSIGDAYAFFFYQKEVQFLAQQVRGPKPSVMSTGIGGIGELQAAKNMRLLGGYFLVHHCVTSMLRLGDVTLIDLHGFKVAGIGELKSHSDQPGHVIVSMSILGEGPGVDLRQGMPEPAPEMPLSNVVDQLTNAAKDRLKRQMNRIQQSHVEARKKPDSLASIESENRIVAMQRLLRRTPAGRVAYAVAGRSLALFAYRLSSQPLSKRLRSKGKPARKMMRGLDALPNKVQEILVPGRSDNAVLLSWFFYRQDGHFHYLPGMTHPFWWPISPKALKPVVFRQMIVGTAYNPAWLFEALEEAGFDVDSADPRNAKISRREGDALFQSEGTSFYIRAIQDYLMNEGSIVKMLTFAYESTVDDVGKGPKRVDLILHQKFGRPDEEDAAQD